jgi:hypothetical protein
MSRRLGLFALLLAAFVPASGRAADVPPPKEAVAPTGTITGSPAILAKTKAMKLAIDVSADDHGGSGIASIHLFYVRLPGGPEVHIRDFTTGSNPQTFKAQMTWITGVRSLPIGKYELHAKYYDIQENVGTGSFPFQIVDAGKAPRQKVDLQVDPAVGSSGLTLKLHAVAPIKVRGKLRVVILARDKTGKYSVVKKYLHGAANPWTLSVPLKKGQYRWQAFYDAKAPFVSTHTDATSFGV